MTFELLASGLALAVWITVVILAVRRKADLVVLALVLIVVGLLGGPALDRLGVEAPGAWAFAAVGLALLVLWPRDRT